MPRTLICRYSKGKYPDGAFREMTTYLLLKPDDRYPHGIQYKLSYYSADKTCLINYDNWDGTGDWRYIDGHVEHYEFISLNRLKVDFFKDIAELRNHT